MRSLTSSDDDPLFDLGGSSMANGNVEMAALSRKKAFIPLTYMAEECEPVRRHNNVEQVILIVKLVASFVEADHVGIPKSNLSRKGQP